MTLLNVTERRSARLLLAPDRDPRAVDEAVLRRRDVYLGVTDRRVPARIVRELQRFQASRGRLTYFDHALAPLAAARRAALPQADGMPPRVLLRVDQFPHAEADDHPDRYGRDVFRRFHAILAEAGVPYLLAVLPRVSREPHRPDARGDRDLDEAEGRLLADLRADGTVFGVNGLDHRTRHRSPRRRSELLGLGESALRDRLDTAEQILAAHAVRPRVFVPPLDRLSMRQYGVLAERYDVVTGGPESVRHLGFHATPLWRGEAVYAPAYAPLHGRAREVLGALDRLEREAAGTWVPVVLRWGSEADAGWEDLRRLAARIAGWAVSWETFLDAVDASR